MNRRDFLSLSGLASALLLLEACGSSTTTAGSPTVPGSASSGSTVPNSTTPNSTAPTSGPNSTGDGSSTTPSTKGATVTGSNGLATSKLARTATSPGDEAAAVTALNSFGGTLAGKLAGTGNLVFSPASIMLAMAMVRAGAVGKTQTEMNTALQIADGSTIDHSINALLAVLATRNGHRQSGNRDGDIELDIANSIWAQNDEQWQQAYLDVLASEYAAGIDLVDYKKDAAGAEQAINTWVSDQTKKRIPTLLSPGLLTAMTRMVLVNTIYLKAPWASAFTKTATVQAPFTRSDGSTVQADMMRRQGYMTYATGAGWQAVTMPYVGGELEMAVVVPDAGTLADTVTGLGSTLAALSSGKMTMVQLGLPKFDFGTKTELSPVLGALGMPTAFTDDADFTGMTTTEPLFISAVIHQANITVDEEGTVAAAATAAVMTAGAAPAEPVTLTIDRPFVFAIRDAKNGAVLFLGMIGDPTDHAGASTA